MRTSLELDCFDGTYSLAIPMSGIIAIEDKFQCGIGEIYARTLAGRYFDEGGHFIGLPLEGRYKLQELTEIVRQALIGGGKGISDGADVVVTPVRANQLISAYCGSISDLWSLAARILISCIEAYEAIEPEAEEGSKKKPEQESSIAVK